MEGRSGASRELVQDALGMLARMTHRAGVVEPGTGDGAGILLGLPHEFMLETMVNDLRVDPARLPAVGDYAVGMVFLGRHGDSAAASVSRANVTNALKDQGVEVIGWREVPANPEGLGPVALETRPQAEMVVARRPPGMSVEEFESRLYVVRQSLTKDAGELSPPEEFDICSLSSSTLVYKGQLLPELLPSYFTDLSHSLLRSHVSLVHSRFSTNTFPSWSRAQPNRLLAHNGEINTLRGNVNWMRAREASMSCDALSAADLEAAVPICSSRVTDSANLDRVLDLLVSSRARSLPEAVRLMVPQAWENDESISQPLRDFYQHSMCAMEPWDGPAMLAFTDGKMAGACLDRNGLRPGRFYVTRDNRVVLASEVGVLRGLDDADVLVKSRLEPGHMLLVDFERGELIRDEQIKEEIAARHPYAEWNRSAVHLRDWTSAYEESQRTATAQVTAQMAAAAASATASAAAPPAGVRGLATVAEAARVAGSADAPHAAPAASWQEHLQQREKQRLYSDLQAFGYHTEHMDMLLAPMAQGKEPMGSMGFDSALAVMSRFPKPPSAFMKQLFAQVTNPPLDPIRESCVMSMECAVGPEGNLLEPGARTAQRLLLPTPVLLSSELEAIANSEHRGWRAHEVDITYPVGAAAAGDGSALESALDRICDEAERALSASTSASAPPPLLLLTDRSAGPDRVAVPSLLATGAVHTRLLERQLRTRVGLLVQAGDAREVHDFCTLLGFGADAVCPHLSLRALEHMVQEGMIPKTVAEAHDSYRSAIEAGMKKVMAKMGISVLRSYKGAQIFEALGLDPSVVDKCFRGCAARISGADFHALQHDLLQQHGKAYAAYWHDAHALEEFDEAVAAALREGASDLGGLHPPSVRVPTFECRGEFHYRKGGEEHLNTPRAITNLQRSVRDGEPDAFQQFVEETDAQNAKITLRGLLRFRDQAESVPLEDVEPATSIVRRFATGAMSLGSISSEAHQTLARAMNEIGGRSNTGEGGEDAARCEETGAGSSRSAIKQVASGRFGVTSHYLANADDLQIKIAQGAKPGEGGELSGTKVFGEIARLRKTTAGVGLVSPPPLHDIYSIEDLAQLIYDLKMCNRKARVSVKLVSEVGVGTVAAGVAKAGASHITVSGHDGGTGAAVWTGIRNAGLPWELGVAEAQQTLVANGLRGRVVMQTDGQLRTGRDVVIAALLGAEEYAFSTAPLISLGCVMMRKCHLNTCPVGIATQDPELRRKFAGKPEHVVRYFFNLAEDVRRHLAALGFRSLDEAIGRAGEVLEMDDGAVGRVGAGVKARLLDLSPLLKPSSEVRADVDHRWDGRRATNELEGVLDWELIRQALPALEGARKAVVEAAVTNTDRSVGGMLSYEVSKRHGAAGLPDGSITVRLRGHAGQSVGMALASGIEMDVVGDANDFAGKSLSGGSLAVFPDQQALHAGFATHENVIVGNAVLYGATSGSAFFSGKAGERFAVRNSGATSVVEGVGDHGCEYMTGGTVAILGPTGRNFAAGMSGGVAYVFDEDGTFAERCNQASVELIPGLKETEDEATVRSLVEEHHRRTLSPRAGQILSNWSRCRAQFVKVFPYEYQRALREQAMAAGAEGAM